MAAVAKNPAKQLPKIDFAGIDPAAPGAGARWNAVRDEVVNALRTHGCFEAVYDGLVAVELRSAVLGPGGAAESLHALPVTTKERNRRHVSGKPFHGYGGKIPSLAFESLVFANPQSQDAVRAFAEVMWPDSGNPAFCDTVHAYAEALAVVEGAVRRMVLESLGASAEYVTDQAKATVLLLQFSEYGAPDTPEGRLGLAPHRDSTLLAVLTQNDVYGLEIEDGDGWLRPSLSPNSFLVFAGDSLKALTNGRVYNPRHRVVMGGDKTRYSTILFSIPKEGILVQPPKEVVDEHHPALYKSFDYADYFAFRNSPKAAHITDNKLEAFCALPPHY